MANPSEPPIEVIHFADPWCWWSWGLEPVLQRLREVYGDHLKVTYRMAGEFHDLAHWMQEYGVDEASTVEWIHESIGTMGNPVRPDYYARCGVKSTFPACLAVKAAQLQSEEIAAKYFRRLMEAYMLECRPASHQELERLAVEVGLDGHRIRRDMEAPPVKEAFDEDRRQMEDLEGNFLSLVIRAPGVPPVVKGETFTAKPFEEIIDGLAPGLPKRSPTDILEYMDHHRDLTTAHEIAEVFRIADGDAAARLGKLADYGILEARSYDGIKAWRWKVTGLETLPLEIVRTSHVPPEVQVEATTDLAPIVTKAVQALYTEVATRPDKAYHFPLGMEALRHVGYPEEDLAKLPATAKESFAGVGFPHAANAMKPGDTVLDIGSGSGTDALFASLKVGPTGKVYGLDITPAMIAKARANIAAAGAKNVEILEGDATKIPLPDASVDVVTSNGVLNLVPNKAAAFREIFRVLRPGGRLQLADIVVREDVGAVCGLNPQLWADCIGGAAVEPEYMEAIRTAGFADAAVIQRLDYFAKSSSESTRRLTRTFGAESVVLAAVKPA